MDRIYYAESKLITGRKVFEEIYYYMEENFNDSPLEFFGYYLLNSFYKDSKGRSAVNIHEEQGSKYFNAKALVGKSGLNINMKCFHDIEESKGIVLTYYKQATIETPYILVVKDKESIKVQATESQDALLEKKISETYNYMVRNVEDNHLR